MSNETELQDFLRKEAASAKKGGTILLVLGIVVVVAIVGYFGYILNYLRANWQAKDVVDVASHQAELALDQAVPQIENWVVDQLPGLMDRAKDELIDNMPEGRRRLEELLAQAADDLAEKVHEQASEQVDQVMRAHGREIRAAIEAAGDVQKSESAREDLKKALEEEFEAVAVRDLDPRVHEYLKALEDMDTELAILVDTPVEELSQERRLERELLQIVYTLIERNYARYRGLGAKAG